MRKFETLFKNAGAAIIVCPDNLFYFSGYLNEDAALLLLPESAYYYTDSRISGDAKEAIGSSVNVVETSLFDVYKEIKKQLDALNIKTVGIEMASMLLSTYNEIVEIFEDYELVNISGEITELRAVKSEDEINRIIRAQDITDKAFDYILNHLKQGMTERELVALLEAQMLLLGADGVAFPTICAFNENGAKPHAKPGTKPLVPGTLVTLDFGAKFKGYCSDMTRTFAYGEIPEKKEEIYYAVLTAQLKALKEICEGMPCKEADSLARDYFNTKNFGAYFTHSLGHGVGIAVHEAPTLSQKSNAVLKFNMVVTVEPGLYIPDFIGVRIEDMIVIKKNEILNLTKSTKNLIILKI